MSAIAHPSSRGCAEPSGPGKETTLSQQRPTSNATTRRQRRAEQRDRRRRTSEAARRSGGASLAWRSLSPTLRVTLATVLVGVVVLGVLLVVNVLGGSNQALRDPAEPVPAELATGRTLGKADAPVKMDVWEDFQCPNCDTFSSGIEPRLVNQFVRGGTVQITYHDFLVIDRNGSHESLDAAVAARCALDQDKFWLYSQYLFANQGPVENGGTFTKSLFDAIATRMGLNVATFDACLADPATAAAVQAEAAEGQQKGVSGTPAVFVNGEQRPNYSLTALTADIEAAAKGEPLPGSSGAPGASSSAPPESTLPPESPAAPATESPAPAAPAASPTP